MAVFAYIYIYISPDIESIQILSFCTLIFIFAPEYILWVDNGIAPKHLEIIHCNPIREATAGSTRYILVQK